MADVTVIATAAITGFVGFFAAWAQSRSGTRLAQLENTERRRDDRKQAYATVMDLLVELGWRGNDRDYDVVRDFNLPFLRAANQIRLHGSPRTVAAIYAIQEAFRRQNMAATEADREVADDLLSAAQDEFVVAAREDVGPRAADRLTQVPFPRGLGPPALRDEE